MNIQDSNPERKNLVITSLSIILFFLSGASFEDNQVRLSLINVTFKNPDILIYFIWILFGWFLFRYWQIHRGSWIPNFQRDISEEHVQVLHQKHLIKKFKLEDCEPSILEWKYSLFIGVYNEKLHFINQINEEHRNAHKRLEITFLDWIFLAPTLFKLLFTKETLLSYFFPYSLALWALYHGASTFWT